MNIKSYITIYYENIKDFAGKKNKANVKMGNLT